MPAQAKIELSGPFFVRDPRKTVRANIRLMLDGLSDELGEAVKGDIVSHQGAMPNWTGWTLDHTYGYTTSPRTGKHWELWAAVATVSAGMDKKQAIRTKAAAATIEARWHPFRRGKSAVYRARALISANLTKGLE